MSVADWQPSCDRATWIARQRLMARVRQFFGERGVLEVETPILSGACGTDPHLDYFATEQFVDVPSASTKRIPRYLMTSPEFHMKRLLAAGFGDCWQVARAFRNGENGPRHNCEFTMVEWYRVGYTLAQLIEEVEALVSVVLEKPLQATRTTWRDAFARIGIQPLLATENDWISCCERQGVPAPPAGSFSQSDWWDYILSTVIEPTLGANGGEFLMEYPPSQAALAQVHTGSDGNAWAQRFELYVNGVELCNGYLELLHAEEQCVRFLQDLQMRNEMGKRMPLTDERFIAALRHGMPACSGVALGLDRLFLLALGKNTLQEVLLFPDDRA